MSESQHDLATEFPEFKDRIHELKLSNAHFRKLLEKYYELNKLIHRAEARIELMTEIQEEELRKNRLQVKDELYGMLRSGA